MEFELVAFDMDGTLVEEVSCWSKIHKEFDVLKDANKNFQAWNDGEIEYKEFMRRDIQLWNPNPHISEIKEILSDYRVFPEAVRTIEKIQEQGYETVIISGGIDVLAKKVAEDLNISHVRANGLETDDDGYLTGGEIFRVDPLKKDEVLIELAEELGIGTEKCVGVGNSIYDNSLFEGSGLGIAVGEGDGVERAADVVISNFENYDRILDYL